MSLPPEYLTPKDTASLLGVSERTLARWHVLRMGPARIAIGRKVLYRLAAIRNWLLANETVSRSPFSGGGNGHA